MANTEKDIADEILRAGGLSASRSGLRFDRVVVGVLGDLRAFADAATPGGVTLIVAISAPIHRPAKTVDSLKRDLAALLSGDAPRGDRAATYHGNSARMRLVQPSSTRAISLVGFVHNADCPPTPLMDLAERWLSVQDPLPASLETL